MARSKEAEARRRQTPEYQAYQREYQPRWRAENRDKMKAHYRAYHQRNPGKSSADHMRKRYGITPAELAELIAKQDGKCAICADPLVGKVDIDHCHQRNFIRGVLCPLCNKGIGMFREDPARLLAAIEYLKIKA